MFLQFYFGIMVWLFPIHHRWLGNRLERIGCLFKRTNWNKCFFFVTIRLAWEWVVDGAHLLTNECNPSPVVTVKAFLIDEGKRLEGTSLCVNQRKYMFAYSFLFLFSLTVMGCRRMICWMLLISRNVWLVSFDFLMTSDD